jgi:hypothetical protein
MVASNACLEDLANQSMLSASPAITSPRSALTRKIDRVAAPECASTMSTGDMNSLLRKSLRRR